MFKISELKFSPPHPHPYLRSVSEKLVQLETWHKQLESHDFLLTSAFLETMVNFWLVFYVLDTVNCALLKFSDGTKGVRAVSSEADAMKLQADLDNIFRWSTDWQMLFNLEKCHVLHLGNNNPNHEYNINGYKLSSVDEEKDLGVYITNSCTPSRQVSVAALKANQVLGQLLRSFTYRDCNTIRLYKQYVRPHLEYCVQAWSAWQQQDITTLENVQCRAVNAAPSLSGTYEEKLSSLNLLSLQQRRLRGDMLQTFKMVKSIDNLNPADFFTFSANRHQYATRLASSIN